MSFFTTAARMWLTKSFRPFIFTNEYDNRLLYNDTEALGLYVHIPFCQKLCDFCPYCKILYNVDIAKSYVQALLQEIEVVGSSNRSKKEITSLYFGGGSPALLSQYMGEIISRLQKYFIIKDGIGVELHPNDVTVEKLLELYSAGVTRISIGIQSFQDEFLNLLGRKKIDYTKMFDAIKTVPFETVSMDFIFALPNQTFDQIKKDIDTAFQNGANHIAIYPFIDFAFTESEVLKMLNNEKHRLLDNITDYCEKQGYIRDSIWTFSKEKINGYSSMTRDNFLGFGCSATTLLKDQFKINTFSIDEYINRINNNKLPTALTLRFTLRQRMIYYLFWTAYTTKINPTDFNNFFDVSLNKVYGFEFWIAQKLGYVIKEKAQYRMTKKGAFYYHYFENFYTLSYIDKMWGIMKNEAFPQKMIL